MKTKMKTKKLVLNSMNPEKYPGLEIECRMIDDIKSYVKDLTSYWERRKVYPEKAIKNENVTAREGKIGEEADTRVRIFRDGKYYTIGETKNEVKIEGSMIVTNITGEEYIVKPEVFSQKYKPTTEKGVFAPISKPITYLFMPEDIVFQAPWGEEMFGLQGGVLVIDSLDDIYAIQDEIFMRTYDRIQNSSNTISMTTYYQREELFK